MYWAEHQGVYFVEAMPAGAQILKSIDTKLDGFFTQSQLKSLDAIKDKMVIAVQEAGGNAVIDFKYGQRSTFWKSLFGMDNVLWHASGTIARIDAAALAKHRRSN